MQLDVKKFSGIIGDRKYRIDPILTKEYVCLTLLFYNDDFDMYFSHSHVLKLHNNTPESIEEARHKAIDEAENQFGILLLKRQELKVA